MKAKISKFSDDDTKAAVISILRKFILTGEALPSSGNKAHDYCRFLIVSLRSENKSGLMQFLHDYVRLLQCENIPLMKPDQNLLVYRQWARNHFFIDRLCSLMSKIKIREHHANIFNAILLCVSKNPTTAIRLTDVLVELFKGIECNKHSLNLCMKILDLWRTIIIKLIDKNVDQVLYREHNAIITFVRYVKTNLFKTGNEKIDFICSELNGKTILHYEHPILLNKRDFYSKMKIVSHLPMWLYKQSSLSAMLHFSHVYFLCPAFFNSRMYLLQTEYIKERSTDLISFFFQDYHFPQVLVGQKIDKETDNYKDIITWLLKGNNLRNFPGLPITLTKKASHFLTHLHETEEWNQISPFKNTIYQLLFYAQLRVNGAEVSFASEASWILKNKTYLGDKNQWIGVFTQLCRLGVSHDQIEYCVDYLNYRGDVSFLNKISIVRLLDEVNHWHIATCSNSYDLLNKNLAIPYYGVKNFEYKTGDEKYVITQVKSTRELFEEGLSMKHCVYSYLRGCLTSGLAIYSLQKHTKNGEKIRLVTIELISRLIVQARGKYNRFYTREEMNILQMWAQQENLKIAV